jgi:hypothetical protein
MQATSDKDVSIIVYYHCVYVGNPTHTVYASIYRHRQRNEFSSFATCVFMLAKVGTAAYALGVRYVYVELLNVHLYRFKYVNTGKSCFTPWLCSLQSGIKSKRHK